MRPLTFIHQSWESGRPCPLGELWQIFARPKNLREHEADGFLCYGGEYIDSRACKFKFATGLKVMIMAKSDSKIKMAA